MARWAPDARGRLLRAALDLFATQGYEATTAAQIAERAGVTKTTLFRLFADKREILFQGQADMVAVVSEGVLSAAAEASAIELLRVAVVALCDAHVPEQQDLGARIERLVASSRELQERTAFKRSVLTAALEAALHARLGDRHLAGALADLGIRAYYAGFARWTHSTGYELPTPLVLDELDGLQRVLSEALPAVVPAPPGASR